MTAVTTRARTAVIALLWLCGCGEEETTSPPVTPDPTPTACEFGDIADGDGGCRAPGVPPEACGVGFVSDEQGGCLAPLPAAPCSGGQTALVGDSECRELVSCGDGSWGDIATDAGTQHVDASYGGGGSNGSSAAPWTTIGDAINAAASGATIAIAAGDYAEAVVIDRPLTLWGRCPTMVTIRGGATSTTPIVGITAISNAVLRGVALAGPRGALNIDSSRVEVRDVWIHDATIGVQAVARGSDAEVAISNSRIEHVNDVGLLLLGASATLVDSVIHDVVPLSDGRFGRGIDAEWLGGRSAALAVERSIVDGAREFGVYVSGSTLDMQSTLVRNVEPAANSGEFGRGIVVQSNLMGTRSTATIAASVVEHSSESGIDVRDSDASFDAVVVRDTSPRTDQMFGHGASLHDEGLGATLTLERSLIERCYSIGVGVFGGQLTTDGLAVRSVAPMVGLELFGRGISVQPNGAIAAGSTIVNSAISDTNDVALTVFDAPTSLQNCRIEGAARLTDDAFGDGINVVGTTASLELSQVLVRDAIRAGLGNFSASVSLSDCAFMCNAVHINGEAVPQPFSYDDRGGNECGCGDERETCRVLSSALEPPEAGGGND